MGIALERVGNGLHQRNTTGRLYLRVAALGLLWCALGLGLGINLTIRLHTIRSDAIALSSDRLPIALAAQRVDEKLAHADALAHRLVNERGDADATEVTTARLREVIRDLDAAITAFDSEAFDVAGRVPASEARTSASTVVKKVRTLLIAELPPQLEQTLLSEISTQAAIADAQLEQLNEQSLTPAVSTLAEQLESQSRRIASETLITGAIAFVFGTVLTIVVARLVWRKEQEQATDRAQQDFQSCVAEAFGMADEEEDAFGLLNEIVQCVTPRAPSELLLADSSRAHFSMVASACGEPGAEPMCSVRSPSCCPAVRRGNAISFASSENFDACPHLRGRASGACGATCVPLSVMGQHVGVLHVVTPVDEPLSDWAKQRLSVVTAKSGERIGVIRAFAQSEQQAARDPLTGLMNRRSLESEVQRLQRSGIPFCVAYADLDHFKQLNDTHGHETGDKVLRLFSRVVRESLRPGDLIARWGGEEFIVLLPNLELTGARLALDRVREAIAETSGGGSVPSFTVSIGLTRCTPDDDFFERLDEADTALLGAKGAGRNRVLVSESAITMPARLHAAQESSQSVEGAAAVGKRSPPGTAPAASTTVNARTSTSTASKSKAA